MKKQQIQNVMVRAVCQGAKLLFVIGIASRLDRADLGMYGLISATVTLLIYILGLEYYSYTTRKLIGRTHDEREQIFAEQFGLSIANIIIGTIIFAGCAKFIGINSEWVATLLVIIAISEYLSQECQRILVVMQNQKASNIILTLKTVAWIVPALILVYASGKFVSLDQILIFWVIGAVISMCYGILSLKAYGFHGRIRINLNSYLYGLRKSWTFLAGSICTQLIFTLDKYFVRSDNGEEFLGTYVFYNSIAYTFITLLDAGLFSIYVAKMIASVSDRDISNLATIRGKLKKWLLIMAGFYLAAMVISFLIINTYDPLTKYSGHPIVFIIIVIAYLIYGVSGYFQNELYIHRRDVAQFILYAICLTVFLLVYITLGFSEFAYTRVPLSILIAMCALAYGRYYACTSMRFLRERILQHAWPK